MLLKRDWIIFFAGAEAFHAVSHAVLYFAGVLPLRFFFMTLTPPLDLMAIGANAAISLALLWWASKN